LGGKKVFPVFQLEKLLTERGGGEKEEDSNLRPIVKKEEALIYCLIEESCFAIREGEKKKEEKRKQQFLTKIKGGKATFSWKKQAAPTRRKVGELQKGNFHESKGATSYIEKFLWGGKGRNPLFGGKGNFSAGDRGKWG